MAWLQMSQRGLLLAPSKSRFDGLQPCSDLTHCMHFLGVHTLHRVI